jgi:glycosyltransferase involved in cell wall biosynthesis
VKIAWFTPFSSKSAIGRCSAGIVEELAKLAQVDVLCFDSDETHSTNVTLRKFTSPAAVTEDILAEYDIAIYNFGNYLPFHGDIIEVSRRHPGIAVLHDFVMHHLFAGYYLQHLKAETLYVQAMERLYGRRGKRAAVDSLSSAGPRVWETDAVVSYPLFELVTGTARGVITHSEFLKKRVEDSFVGPVCKISLPYTIDRQSPLMSRQDLGVSEKDLLIVTVGHANRNKRIISAIEAIGQLDRSEHSIQYVIAGPCARDYRRELKSAIAQNGLEGAVRIAGEVSDQELRSYLSHADICINLRWPAIEGASASAIEEMLFGKPLIVGNVGFYAELPEDSVVRIDPQSMEQLRDALARLASSAEERTRLGAAAREYAEGEFRSDSYARQLIAFLGAVQGARPLLDLTDTLARQLDHMGISADMQIVDDLAGELDTLFSGGETIA